MRKQDNYYLISLRGYHSPGAGLMVTASNPAKAKYKAFLQHGSVVFDDFRTYLGFVESVTKVTM